MGAPFTSAGGAKEIAGVQLHGGSPAAPGAAAAVDGALKVALPFLKDQHTRGLKEEVTGQVTSLKEALEATRNPSIAQSKFREEALANPITAGAFKEFTLIQDAAAQGRLPGDFALERLEDIQKQAIAKAPEFEQEIRQAMMMASGQDPQKTIFSRLMAPVETAVTPEMKAMDDLRQESFKNGITVEQQQEVNHQMTMGALEQARLNRKKSAGTYALLDATTEANNRAGTIMVETMSALNRQRQAGGITPEFSQQAVAQSKIAVTAAIADITASAKGVDGAQVAAAVAPLLQLQEQIEGMAEDGTLEALVSSKNILGRSIIEGEILKSPSFGTAWVFGGQRGTMELLKFMETGTNPASKQLLGNINEKAKLAFQIQGIGAAALAEQYGKLGAGVPAETTEEKNARALAASIALGTAGLDDAKHITALGELQAIDKELAWSVFASRKVITSTSNSKALQAAFINLQEATTVGLNDEYATLTVTPGFDTKKLHFAGGKLVYAFDPKQLKGTNAEANAAGVAFVDRFNRANNISAAHMNAGNLPSTRYTDTQRYWDTVTQGSEQEEVVDVQAPTTIKWGRDSNGLPVRLSQ
jgi:hypothetical protein